jgi:hypothetical protein
MHSNSEAYAPPIYSYKAVFEEQVRWDKLTIQVFCRNNLLFTKEINIPRGQNTIITHGNDWVITVTPQHHFTFIKGGIAVITREVK